LVGNTAGVGGEGCGVGVVPTEKLQARPTINISTVSQMKGVKILAFISHLLKW
jgi:hypothetical protein